VNFKQTFVVRKFFFYVFKEVSYTHQDCICDPKKYSNNILKYLIRNIVQFRITVFYGNILIFSNVIYFYDGKAEPI